MKTSGGSSHSVWHPNPSASQATEYEEEVQCCLRGEHCVPLVLPGATGASSDQRGGGAFCGVVIVDAV